MKKYTKTIKLKIIIIKIIQQQLFMNSSKNQLLFKIYLLSTNILSNKLLDDIFNNFFKKLDGKLRRIFHCSLR